MSSATNNFSDIGVQKSFASASYTSSLLSTVGGALTLNDIAILLGIMFAVLTFAVNWLYQARRDRREKLLHELELEVARQELLQQSSER